MPITRPKERTLPGSPTDRRPENFSRRTRDECAGFFMPDSPPRYGTMPGLNRFFFPHGSAFPQYSPNLPFRRFIVGDPPPPLLRPTDSDLFFVSRETAFRPAIFPCGSPRLTGFLLRQNARATMECAVYMRFTRSVRIRHPLKRVATSYARRLRKSEGSLLNRK